MEWQEEVDSNNHHESNVRVERCSHPYSVFALAALEKVVMEPCCLLRNSTVLRIDAHFSRQIQFSEWAYIPTDLSHYLS